MKTTKFFVCLLMLIAYSGNTMLAQNCKKNKINHAGKACKADKQLVQLIPDVNNDRVLNLSGKNDHKDIMFPVWDRDDIYTPDDEDVSEWEYCVNLGADGMPLQALQESLMGVPADIKEVGRQILIDLNFDGYSDLAVCVGRYGEDKALYFDAWIWDPEEFGGLFVRAEGFRNIPNPVVDNANQCIRQMIPAPAIKEDAMVIDREKLRQPQEWKYRDGKFVKVSNEYSRKVVEIKE